MTERYTSLNLVFGDEKDRKPNAPAKAIDLGSPEQVRTATNDLVEELEGPYSDSPWRDPLDAAMTLIKLIKCAKPEAKTGFTPDIINRAFKAIEHKIKTIPPEKEDPVHWAWQHHMFGCTVVNAGLKGLPPDQEKIFRERIERSRESVRALRALLNERRTGLPQPE